MSDERSGPYSQERLLALVQETHLVAGQPPVVHLVDELNLPHLVHLQMQVSTPVGHEGHDFAVGCEPQVFKQGVDFRGRGGGSHFQHHLGEAGLAVLQNLPHGLDTGSHVHLLQIAGR